MLRLSEHSKLKANDKLPKATLFFPLPMTYLPHRRIPEFDFKDVITEKMMDQSKHLA